MSTLYVPCPNIAPTVQGVILGGGKEGVIDNVDSICTEDVIHISGWFSWLRLVQAADKYIVVDPQVSGTTVTNM